MTLTILFTQQLLCDLQIFDFLFGIKKIRRLLFGIWVILCAWYDMNLAENYVHYSESVSEGLAFVLQIFEQRLQTQLGEYSLL